MDHKACGATGCIQERLSTLKGRLPALKTLILDAVGLQLVDRMAAQLHDQLERLVRTRGVVVDDIDAVIDALGQFRQGGDLADQLILARATNTGALPVLSFDRRFAASEGVELLCSS